MILIKNLKNKTVLEINAAFPHNQDNKCYVFLLPEDFAQEEDVSPIIYYRDELIPQ